VVVSPPTLTKSNLVWPRSIVANGRTGPSCPPVDLMIERSWRKSAMGYDESNDAREPTSVFTEHGSWFKRAANEI
jgi:hypothetical protein